MSDSTQPVKTGPHFIESAGIGARLAKSKGRGRDYAKLVWFAVLSHTPWDTFKRPTWACDETLAHDVGIDVREAERALQRLRAAGMLETPIGHRPGADRPVGRVLRPKIWTPVRVVIPTQEQMGRLWGLLREHHERPVTLVTTMVGLHVLAAHDLGRRPTGLVRIPWRMAEVRRFVGSRKNAAWTSRLRRLEGLDLIRRDGRDLWLAPMRHWSRTARVLDEMQGLEDEIPFHAPFAARAPPALGAVSIFLRSPGIAASEPG